MSETKQDDILWALESRRSIRAFEDRDVPHETVERILEAASRAPSGTNIQPWKVYVVRGQTKQAITDSCMKAHEAGDQGEEPYPYYPPKWVEPYIGRRRKIGLDMYGLLEIKKGDVDAMSEQFAQNYKFFGAPVGLFFVIDTQLAQGSWFDYGMFVQNIMTAARAFGLSTCPQQAFAKYADIIKPHLGCGDEYTLICGMSLGYEDRSHVVNKLRTEREPVSGFTTFLD